MNIKMSTILTIVFFIMRILTILAIAYAIWVLGHIAWRTIYHFVAPRLDPVDLH